MNATTLICTEGRSNKQYVVQLTRDGDRFHVDGIGGAIGGHMTTYRKTKEPVGLEAAAAMMAKLIREKVAGGYRLSDVPAPPVQVAPKVEFARPATKHSWQCDQQPMLLNPIERAEAEQLLSDPRWMLEMKYDGVRCLLHRDGAQVRGVSRTGKPLTLPAAVVKAAIALASPTFTIDGELVDQTFICFDVLRDDGADFSRVAAYARADHYAKMLATSKVGILPAPYALTQQEKRAFFETLEAKGAEGAVFKLKTATYSAGRPNSGGNALKFKFVATASVIVVGPNGTKRSVAIQLHDGTDLGHVTIPPNKTVPATGAVIEVRYLYQHDVGGHLVQAVYLAERCDVEPAECVAAQLQVKGKER